MKIIILLHARNVNKICGFNIRVGMSPAHTLYFILDLLSIAEIVKRWPVLERGLCHPYVKSVVKEEG